MFTTATFVGYLVGSAGGQDVTGGVAAALLATLGIFLPSFVFVALSGPLVPRLRRWPRDLSDYSRAAVERAR